MLISSSELSVSSSVLFRFTIFFCSGLWKFLSYDLYTCSILPMAMIAGSKVLPSEVVVHPLVLLSTVDHYFRVAKDTKKRVVGILLGESWKGKIDVTNCYAGLLCLCE